MLGLLRTLIFIIGVYYLVRFIMKYIVPVFREEKKQAPPKYHKTYTEQTRPNRGKFADSAGEYTDYEEIN